MIGDACITLLWYRNQFFIDRQAEENDEIPEIELNEQRGVSQNFDVGFGDGANQPVAA
jgi:hypothetical protein